MRKGIDARKAGSSSLSSARAISCPTSGGRGCLFDREKRRNAARRKMRLQLSTTYGEKKETKKPNHSPMERMAGPIDQEMPFFIYYREIQRKERCLDPKDGAKRNRQGAFNHSDWPEKISPLVRSREGREHPGGGGRRRSSEKRGVFESGFHYLSTR